MRWLRFLLIFALLFVLVPRSVQAGGVDGAFTGVIDAHVNVRMADAIVDLVRVSNEENSVWAVAGFLYCCDDQGLVYQSNGAWRSSAEVAESVGKTVRLSPYRDKNPRVQYLEELFGRARYLFWRIRILETGRRSPQIFVDRDSFFGNLGEAYQ